MSQKIPQFTNTAIYFKNFAKQRSIFWSEKTGNGKSRTKEENKQNENKIIYL